MRGSADCRRCLTECLEKPISPLLVLQLLPFLFHDSVVASRRDRSFSFVYFRRHGGGGIPETGPSEEEEVALKWLTSGKVVFRSDGYGPF